MKLTDAELLQVGDAVVFMGGIENVGANYLPAEAAKERARVAGREYVRYRRAGGAPRFQETDALQFLLYKAGVPRIDPGAAATGFVRLGGKIDGEGMVSRIGAEHVQSFTDAQPGAVADALPVGGRAYVGFAVAAVGLGVLVFMGARR